MPLRFALLPALRGPPARLRSAAAWGCSTNTKMGHATSHNEWLLHDNKSTPDVMYSYAL
jgi:hypothetical protein